MRRLVRARRRRDGRLRSRRTTSAETDEAAANNAADQRRGGAMPLALVLSRGNTCYERIRDTQCVRARY